MTIIVKSQDENVITLPSRLLEGLHWPEGSEIKVIMDGQVLRLAPLDQFLALRGSLREDESFDEAMQLLNESWQSWTVATSA